MVLNMKCSICKNKYDIQDFNSLRIYDDEDYLVNKIDICSNCWNKMSKKEENGKLNKLYEEGYKL